MNSKEIDRNEWKNKYASVGNTTGIIWKTIGNQVGKPQYLVEENLKTPVGINRTKSCIVKIHKNERWFDHLYFLGFYRGSNEIIARKKQQNQKPQYRNQQEKPQTGKFKFTGKNM